MAPTTSAKVLLAILLQLLSHVINAQIAEQLYHFDFSTYNGWTQGGAGVGISSNCPDGGKCWYMGKGIAWADRTYSVVGYHNITAYIDIRSWDNEPTEYCNVRYQTDISGGWQTLYNFPGNNLQQIRRNIKMILPSAVDNRADFQIQMWSDHTGDYDWCNYDNLEIWGIPYAATTSIPTTAIPTTTTPTTAIPTTSIPTTSTPTTLVPTTFAPTTSMPTTNNPTTSMPSTFAPTTAIPTTFMPSTVAPTTFIPTTSTPTVYAPTVSPTSDDNGGEVIETTESESARNQLGDNQESDNNNVLLYVFIAIGCLLIVIVACIYVFIKRRKRMRDEGISKDIGALNETIGDTDTTDNIQVELTDYASGNTDIGVTNGEIREGHNGHSTIYVDNNDDDDGLYTVPVNEHVTAGENITAGNEDMYIDHETKGNETIGANTNDLDDKESDDGDDLYGKNVNDNVTAKGSI